jgi:hypothetical protein
VFLYFLTGLQSAFTDFLMDGLDSHVRAQAPFLFELTSISLNFRLVDWFQLPDGFKKRCEVADYLVFLLLQMWKGCFNFLQSGGSKLLYKSIKYMKKCLKS